MPTRIGVKVIPGVLDPVLVTVPKFVLVRSVNPQDASAEGVTKLPDDELQTHVES